MQNKDEDIIALMVAKSNELQKKLSGGNNLSLNNETDAQDIINNNIKKGKTSVKVGNKDYTFKKYTISQWLMVTPIFGKTLAPTFTLLTEGKLTEAAMVIFDSLGEGQFEIVVNMLLTQVSLNGENVTIDTVENPTEMLELCVKVLQLNYQDVFTRGITGLGAAMQSVMGVSQTL